MNVDTPVKTIGTRRRETTARLVSVAGEHAAFESYRLLGHICRCGPTELTLRAGDTLTPVQEAELERFVLDRLTGRPLAYVLGHAYFAGLDLTCDERALIPRPETEELVDIALRCLPPPGDRPRPVVIDVGTGSGNIALAVADQRPDAVVLATDTEWPALRLADENRKRLGMAGRVRLISGRSLSMFKPARAVDVIVSNPPYIALGNPFVEKSVLDFEPHSALFAGPTGLEIVTELLDAAKQILRPGGWFISEIGYDHGDAVRELLASRKGWDTPTLHRDMSGIERVVSVRTLPTIR